MEKFVTKKKMSKKAVKCGFEWTDEESLIEFIYSEFKEFKEASDEKDNFAG